MYMCSKGGDVSIHLRGGGIEISAHSEVSNHKHIV